MAAMENNKNPMKIQQDDLKEGRQYDTDNVENGVKSGIWKKKHVQQRKGVEI